VVDVKNSLVQTIFVDIWETLLKAAVNACTSFEIERRVRNHEKTSRRAYNSLEQTLDHDMSCQTRFQLSVCQDAGNLQHGVEVTRRVATVETTCSSVGVC